MLFLLTNFNGHEIFDLEFSLIRIQLYEKLRNVIAKILFQLQINYHL